MSNLNLTKIRSSYNGQTPSTGKEVEDAFNDNFEAIDASLETLGALNQDLFSFPGYISGYNGKVVDSDSYLHTVYIPVVNAKSITVTGFSGGPVTGLALIAFYNKYKTHTGMFGTGTEPADVTATVPAASFPQDTYYVRCTARPQQANRSVTISFASIMQTVVDSGNAFSATLYNVTQNNPLPDGQYYTAVSARLAVPVELRRPGLILTFALSAQQWFTMQFTGTDPASFTHPDFWNDIQAMINASLTPLQQQIAAINNSIATMAGNIAQVGQTASGASALATLLQQHLATVDNSITTMAGNIAQVGQTASGASALAALTKENLDALTDTVDELSAGLLAVDNAKVDYGYVENGFLFLTSKGETVGDPIELPAGGGGSGGGGSTLRLINQGGSSMGVAAGQPVVISYIYQSTDSETGEATGDGTAQYYVNNVRVATRSIQQGLNTFDATPHLTAGANSVKVQVTDSYGAVRSMNVSVAVMSLSLSSSFDDGAVYDGPVSFPFTPVGSGQKTVYFVLDGTVGTMETTATNRQLIYPLGALGHGFHLLKVYAEMTVQGVTVRSNELVYGITFVEAGAQEVIISSPFVRESAGQYETVVIPFTVYNPASLTSAVALMTKTEGGDWQTVSTLTVDRTRQAWSYRIASSGTLDLKIVSGSAFVSFQLEVSASSISADAETEGLELFLTSEGRNNAESNPGEWAYGDIKAIFTGLNWKTNGWILDAGNTTVLRLNAGARVNLPLKPFAQDFKNAGKTVEIEFAVHDVEDFTVPVISCWSGGRGFRITPNRVDFASQLSSLAANFKEDEIIRLSIVVENRYDKHLILLYINGVASGAQQYSLSDDFSQTSPAGIALGTDGTATLDVYTVRVYGQALNGYQILNNYIADTADVARKLALYERNRIYDGSGDIVYSDLVEKLPCMTVTGVLPTFKGDKKTVKIAFENRENPEKSFTSENVQIDVQGTSSQFYPRKNFKTKHNSGFDMSESGEHTDKYVLLGEDIEAKVFCEKADFAESSGTHNTGLARFINTLLVSRNIKTPPQNANANVRTTVDGYPIAIFHREQDNSIPVFVGKYNFNHDKDAQEVFGLTGSAECWEFMNNTSDLCLFKSADFSGAWTDDLSARYPDGFTDKTHLQTLWSWVVSCKNSTSKFISEFEQHFNKNNIISYYVLTELFGMVDQRAKNMFATSWGNEGSGAYKWYFIFYDNDTSNGINNEGAIAFNYNIEDTDTAGSGHVWNGWNSELWKLVVESFADDIRAMYHDMRTSGALTYANAAHVLNEEQCAKWSEAVYNLDGQYKYIQPIVESGNASYLYALQGSRLEHRKWWLKNRFYYMDGKYNTGDFLNDFITMRLYTPAVWDGVEPDADFVLTLLKDGYVRVKYGSYLLGQRGTAGTDVAIVAPAIQFNDTETIVYGVSGIKSLGSLAAKYPGTVDISSAKKLTELIVGSDEEGYENLNLTHIAIGNNTLLKVVDVRNCPNLTEPLDVSGCNNIQEIYADGTNISMVVLPVAGIVSELRLPASITNLTLRNQPDLTADGITVGGVAADALASLPVGTLVLENMNQLDVLGLIQLALSSGMLNRIRIINIAVEANDLSLFRALMPLQGVDGQGNNTATPVVTGTVNVTGQAYESEIAELEEAFPELEITGNVVGDPVTTFAFTSNKSGETLSNTSFVCNRPYTKINDATYTVKAPPGFNIQFVFSADKHQDRTAVYTVTTTRTQGYAMIYMPAVTFIFQRYDSGNVLEGVQATINGQSYVSDANGKIYLRGAGVLSGTATHDYGRANIDATVSGYEDQTFDITMAPYVYIRVRTYMDGGISLPLKGAAVTFDGQTYTTDRSGFTPVIKTIPGEYAIPFVFQGITITGGYTVSESSTVINREFPYGQVNWEALDFGQPDGSVQVIYKGGNITVNSTDADYTIDWGEGYETPATGSGSKTYTPPSGMQSVRFIKVRDCAGITSITYPNSSVIAVLSVGDSKIDYTTDGALRTSQYAVYAIGADVFKAGLLKESVNFYAAFSSVNIRVIPPHLFDGLNVTSFNSCFKGCSWLEKIPEGLFKDNINCADFASVFYNAGLSAKAFDVPGVFPETSGSSFSEAFRGSAIGHVREELLSGITVTNSQGLFNSCAKLKTAVIPANVQVTGSFFASCTALQWVEFKHATPFELSAAVFLSASANFAIYVPDAAVDAYKAATGWGDYATRILPASQRPAQPGVG